MLITLCYLYLWARWGTYSAGLICRTVRRLHRTRCSFTFCCSGCPRQTLHQPHRLPPGRKEAPSLPGERICLRAGNKVFFTDETQVGCGRGGAGLMRYRRRAEWGELKRKGGGGLYSCTCVVRIGWFSFLGNLRIGSFESCVRENDRVMHLFKFSFSNVELPDTLC